MKALKVTDRRNSRFIYLFEKKIETLRGKVNSFDYKFSLAGVAKSKPKSKNKSISLVQK